MLLQTNSYIVPKEKRAEHTRVVGRFRQALARIGCDGFDVYEQVGSNWTGEPNGRFVQILRFRDRQHQLDVQAAERADPDAQALVRAFCDLINFPYQQHQGFFTVGFYVGIPAAAPAAAPAAVVPGLAPANAADPAPVNASAGDDPSASGIAKADNEAVEEAVVDEAAEEAPVAEAVSTDPQPDGPRFVWDEVTSSDEPPAHATDLSEEAWEPTAELAAGSPLSAVAAAERVDETEPHEDEAPVETSSDATAAVQEPDGAVPEPPASRGRAGMIEEVVADEEGEADERDDPDDDDSENEELADDEDPVAQDGDDDIDGAVPSPDDDDEAALSSLGDDDGGADADDEAERPDDVVEATANAGAVFSDAAVTVADAEAEEPGEVELDETAFELLGREEALGTDDE